MQIPFSAQQPQESLKAQVRQDTEILPNFGEMSRFPLPCFNDLTFLAAQACGTSIAAVALVDATHQGFVSSLGLPNVKIPRAVSLCEQTLLGQEIDVIPDILANSRYSQYPLVASEPHVRFYTGFPLLTARGETLGCLCVMETMPRNLTSAQQECLKIIAHQIVARYERHRMGREWAATTELESQQFLQSTLDALASHVAVLDSQGTIIAINKAWQRFAQENTGNSNTCGIGANYIAVCENATGKDAEGANAVVQGIRAVIAGECAEFSQEYPCHSPGEQRWFIVRITRFEGEGLGYVVVAHENITHRKEIEEKLAASERHFRFLNQLGDATRSLSEPKEIMATVARLLGVHLEASRCAYADVESDENHFTILDDYTNNCVSTVGNYQLTLFGPHACAEMRAGRTLVIHDVDKELSPADGGAMFRAIDVQAIIVCPLIKKGRLSAMIAVHQTTPRLWTNDDIALVQKVVERCWAIIERARAETTLRNSEEHMRFIINTTTDGIWEADLIQKTMYWSDRIYSLLGLSRETFQPSYEAVLKFIHPDDIALFQNAVQQNRRYGQPYHIRVRYKRSDGTYVTVLDQGRTQYNAEGKPIRMIGSLTDLTTLLDAEEALRKGEQEQRQLAERLNIERERLAEAQSVSKVGSWEMDFLTGELTWSDECYRIFGLDPTKAEASYALFLEHVHPEDQAAVNTAYTESIAKKVPYKIDHRVQMEDGTIKIVHERCRTFYDAQGNPIRSIGTVQDITTRKRTEEILQAHALELAEARDSALAATRAKSEFLANMSHEIRTPMNGVLGMTQLLAYTTLDTEQRDYVETLQQSGEALLTVLDEILDYSKLEAGKITLRPVEYDLSMLLTGVISLMQPSARQKGLETGLVIAPEIPTRVLGDSGRLRQVLLNLVGNAIKFTPAGSISLSCSLLEKQPDSIRIRLEVTDTGIGISPDDQARLFQSFFQVDSSHTRRFGGTGLGLAISQALTNLMGGIIGLESTPGSGSTFWIELPLLRVN